MYSQIITPMNLRSVNWRRGDEGGEGMSISNYGAISGCGYHCIWAVIVRSSSARNETFHIVKTLETGGDALDGTKAE